MLRGSDGTLQIYRNINCYSTVSQNNVLYSVMDGCEEIGRGGGLGEMKELYRYS
jgi:hypothetical protein